MRFIGDIHGNLRFYNAVISDVDKSVQVGDFGIGFSKYYKGERIFLEPTPEYVNENIPSGHRFIRGNHDDLEKCKKCNNWIPDGHVENNMMFIGGASSIDKQVRTEGFDWWSDEQLSYSELDNLIQKYEKTRPEIMVCHECPEQIVPLFMPTAFIERSITRMAFNTMFDIHKPKLWIFGHWHIPVDMTIKDTRFICLDINQFVDFPD